MAGFLHMMAVRPLAPGRRIGDAERVTTSATSRRTRRYRVHPAWLVAAVSFVALIGAAGFRATPGALITPLQDEYGWSRGTISLADYGIEGLAYELSRAGAACARGAADAVMASQPGRVCLVAGAIGPTTTPRGTRSSAIRNVTPRRMRNIRALCAAWRWPCARC